MGKFSNLMTLFLDKTVLETTGQNIEGAELIDSVRKEAENCDCFQGIKFTISFSFLFFFILHNFYQYEKRWWIR